MASDCRSAWPCSDDDRPGSLDRTDGRIELAVEASQSVLLVAEDGSFHRGALPLPPAAASDSGPPALPVVVSLRRPSNLSGRVVDAESLEPLPLALVWSGDHPAAVRTDQRGSYALPLGPWTEAAEPSPNVHAAAPGHFPADAPFLMDSPGPGLMLPPRVGLTGRVADRDGQAIAGASLRARYERPRGQFTPLEVPGVLVPPAGESDGGQEGQLPEYVLQPTVSLSGRVQDLQEEPIADVQVTGVQFIAAAVAGGAVTTPERALTTATDREGRFTVEGLRPGSVQLTARAVGWQKATATVPVQPVDRATEGPDPQAVVITLAAAATLQGELLTSEGDPAGGAELRRPPPATGSEWVSVSPPLTRADAEGRYLLDGLAPGPITLVASHPTLGEAQASTELSPGENRLDLRFEAGFELTGQVLDARGEPIHAASVSLGAQGRPAGWRGALTDRDGWFRFSGLSDGLYRVSAYSRGHGGTLGPTPVEIDGQSPPSVFLELAALGAITGQLRGLNLDELAQVEVSVRVIRKLATISYDGTYRIEGLPPGEFTVVAHVPGTGRNAQGRVALEQGQEEALLDLEFGQGLVLSGRLLHNGHPLSGARVSAFCQDTGGWTESEASGSFRIQGLEPGDCVVEVRDPSLNLDHTRTLQLDGDRDLLLEISTGWVQGRVLDATTEEPISGVAIRLEGAGSASSMPLRPQLTGSDGTFTIGPIEAGQLVLSATRDGFRPHREPLSLAMDERAEVEVLMVPAPQPVPPRE